MADDQNQNTNGGTGTQVKIVIPDEAKAKYPDLVPQILKSPSMDNEEKNYWFSVLPIMTDDQVMELRDILASEKKRLAAIDEGQNPNTASVDPEKAAKIRAEKAAKRHKEEIVAREEDTENAEDLLENWN